VVGLSLCISVLLMVSGALVATFRGPLSSRMTMQLQRREPLARADDTNEGLRPTPNFLGAVGVAWILLGGALLFWPTM